MIEATTVTSGGAVVMIIDVLPTIVAGRLDLGARHGINAITKKAPRRNDAKSLAESIARNPVTTEDFSSHGKSNLHPWTPPHCQ